MNWKRIEAGEYESEDERFHIIDTWDRICGKHWGGYDHKTKEEFKGDSLKHAKQIAEGIIEREERK